MDIYAFMEKLNYAEKTHSMRKYKKFQYKLFYYDVLARNSR